MNRLKEFFEEPGDRASPGDYYTVETQCDSFVVTQAVAEGVVRALAAAPLAGWIVFTDHTGARHRVRVRLIQRVSEYTEAQRAVRRAFYRELRREAKADREPWEDED